MSDSCDPVDCSPPGSSVRGVSQARIVESVAISFSLSLWPESDAFVLSKCRLELGQRFYFKQYSSLFFSPSQDSGVLGVPSLAPQLGPPALGIHIGL